MKSLSSRSLKKCEGGGGGEGDGGGDFNLNCVHFESPSHNGLLLSGLNALHNKGLLLDVTLIAGGRKFRAHRVVLASCSEYFRAMFTDALRESQLSEICLKGVSAEGMKGLLDYIYTSRLAINLANVQDILATANHIQLCPVVEACSHYLQEQLDLENCVDIATIAETYSLHPLRKRAYQFMCSCLRHFSRTPDFQRLGPSQLEYLLKCDFPVDCDEAQVLRVVAQWLEHRPAERISFARHLMANIHFDEIPSRCVARFLRSTLYEAAFSASTYPPPPPRRSQRHQRRLQGTAAENEDKEDLGGGGEEEEEMECSGSSSMATATSLLNSRGMELAIVKVGGFGLGGITNEITYLLPSGSAAGNGGNRKWCHLTSIPHVEQCNYGTAVLGNELFVVGGCFNQSLQENIHPFGFRFDPRNDRWATIAPMQQERCRFCLCVVNGELYAVGGVGEGGGGASGGGGMDDGVAAVAVEGGVPTDFCPCEKYDPDADLWLSTAPLPGGGRRTQHAGATLGDLLFVSGGLDQDFVLDSLAAYDASCDRWETRAPMLLPRADHCMVAHKDRLYVCGGWYEDEVTGNRVIVETLDTYDVATDVWTTVSRVPTPRYHAGAVVVDDLMYVVGGFHSDVTFDRATGVVECYSIRDDVWTIVQPYPQDIWEHCCVALYVPRCRDDMEVVADVGS